MTKKIQMTTVPRHEYRNFLDKGLESFQTMKTCLQDSRWNSAVINGVHATISLSDAMTIFKLGKRSTSSSHQDAVLLLKDAVREDPEGQKNAKRLAQILDWKHRAEYESKKTGEREAHDFAKIAERFVEWARSQLP